MSHRILILEDDAAIRENLAAYLEDEGFVVEQAESGEQGLELLNTTSPDLAIVDIRLPGMDGNEWMVKAHTVRPTMKFLIYTGLVDYKIPSELLKLGLGQDEVLFKPVKNMEIISEHIHTKLQS